MWASGHSSTTDYFPSSIVVVSETRHAAVSEDGSSCVESISIRIRNHYRCAFKTIVPTASPMHDSCRLDVTPRYGAARVIAPGWHMLPFRILVEVPLEAGTDTSVAWDRLRLNQPQTEDCRRLTRWQGQHYHYICVWRDQYQRREGKHHQAMGKDTSDIAGHLEIDTSDTAGTIMSSLNKMKKCNYHILRDYFMPIRRLSSIIA